MLRTVTLVGILLSLSGIVEATSVASAQRVLKKERAFQESLLQTTVPWLPADADINRMPEQTVLSERGLYFDYMGRTRRLDAPDQLGCKGGFILEAHRGHPQFPENNVTAAGAGYSARYNAVELDVRMLGDSTWVFQHDATSGRTFQLANYHEKALKNISAGEYRAGKEIDRDGSVTQYSPQTALPVLMSAGSFIGSDQYINIEIKELAKTCEVYGHLNTLITTIIPAHQVSYSTMGNVRPLLCLRQVNTTSRMTVIQGPGRKPLETWAKANHGADLSKLKGNRQTQMAARFIQASFGAHTFPRMSDAKTLAGLKDALGANMGINVEIQDLVDNPGIITRARNAGIRVMSYSINDNDAHLQALKRLRARGTLPDGAIVDSTPIKTCKTIGLES